jgi:6-phosphogluconate dehydrogenase (decarboxylating)
MQINIVGSEHMRGPMARRLAMMRKGFGGHAVAAKDPKP